MVGSIKHANGMPRIGSKSQMSSVHLRLQQSNTSMILVQVWRRKLETAINPACWVLAWHAKDKGSSMSRVDLPIVVGVQKTGADGRHGRLEVQIVVVMAEGNIGHRRLTKIEQVVHGLRPIVKSHDGQKRLMRVCGS